MSGTDNKALLKRRVPLSGAVNFRDLGGLPTTDHRSLHRGLLFRSDHLSRLSSDDHEILKQLHLKMVIDLRSIRERQRSPDMLPGDGSITLQTMPVQDSLFDPATAMQRLRAGDDSWLSMDFVVGLYRRYLEDFGPVWGDIIRLIAAPDTGPLVFHCTGGKDRTGICAALVLKLLGVAQEDIFADHLLSDICNAERVEPIFTKFESMGVTAEKAAFYLRAPVEPLAAMFEHLKKSYGSVEDYLIQKAGLKQATFEHLNNRMLHVL